MIGLSDYAKIKNNYCICYFGFADEYLIQLKLVRPHMERAFPGLNIYIGCKDSSLGFLEGCDKVLKISDLKARKPDFAHIAELRCNGIDHPIETFLTNCGIDHYPVSTNVEQRTNLCSIVAESNFPTKPLLHNQIEVLKRLCIEKGLEYRITNDITGVGMVMGVESPALFEAAAKGIPTTLIPTGVGTRLYKKMFPNGVILEV